MKSYEIELIINKPANKVYEALTTQIGLESWWTTNCKVGTVAGETITIRFGETFKTMVIENLRPNVEISWRVVEAHLQVPGITHTQEWVGTHINFQLEEQPNSATRLKLQHIGLTPQVECYEICSQGWAQFLGSLKSYVETGTGSPFRETLL